MTHRDVNFLQYVVIFQRLCNPFVRAGHMNVEKP